MTIPCVISVSNTTRFFMEVKTGMSTISHLKTVRTHGEERHQCQYSSRRGSKVHLDDIQKQISYLIKTLVSAHFTEIAFPYPFRDSSLGSQKAQTLANGLGGVCDESVFNKCCGDQARVWWRPWYCFIKDGENSSGLFKIDASVGRLSLKMAIRPICPMVYGLCLCGSFYYL